MPCCKAGIRGIERSMYGAALSPLPRAGLTHNGTAQPLMFLPLNQDEGEATSRNVTLQLLWTSFLCSFTSCPFQPPQLHPGEMVLIHPWLHLATVSHMRALCPLQSCWAGICGVGEDRHQAYSFTEQRTDGTSAPEAST